MKVAKIYIVFVIFLATTIFSSCHHNQGTYDCDFFLGVIETTGQENKSFITFYDKDLNKRNTIQLNYGSMGSYFDLPKVYDNSLYVIPKGIANTKDQNIVLQLDLDTGKETSYDIGQPNMNSFCVDEDNVYTVNTLNHNSIISRCNRDTKKVETTIINKVFIGKIDVYNEKLYAFGFGDTEDGEMKSFLYIIDPNDLSIKKELDITAHGQDQLGSILYNNTIYFTNSLKYINGQGEVESTNFCKLEIDDYSLTSIALDEAYPFQILEYQDEFLISHFNLVKGVGNKLTLYDPYSNITRLLTFQHNLAEIQIKEDKLYCTDGKKLYVYSINNTSFQLAKEVDIYTKSKEQAYFYVSGFFLK